MITLGPDDDLQAVAITADIWICITGMEQDSEGTGTAKVLYSGHVPTTLTQLYAPPTGGQTLIDTIYLFNAGAAAETGLKLYSGTTRLPCPLNLNINYGLIFNRQEFQLITPTGPYSSGGGGTSDHSMLSNLDYAGSGHTGFEASANKSTDGTLGGATPSDTLYPSQRAVRAYVDDKAALYWLIG